MTETMMFPLWKLKYLVSDEQLRKLLLLLSRPDHRELFILYVGWGVTVTTVGYRGD